MRAIILIIALLISVVTCTNRDAAAPPAVVPDQASAPGATAAQEAPVEGGAADVQTPDELMEQRIAALEYGQSLIFSDVYVDSDGGLEMRGELTAGAPSLLYVRAITLQTSMALHNLTLPEANYTVMEISYTKGGKEQCAISVPKKAVAPVVSYILKNPSAKDNPYLGAYWNAVVIDCPGMPEVNR